MNKVALITGCSSGIGKSTALLFSRNGIFTYASMRDMSKGEDLKETAEKENIPLVVTELDVTDPKGADNALQKVLTEKGRLDILVNNAGFMVLGSFEDVGMEEFILQLKTDFLGPVLLMKKVLPIMRNQDEDEKGTRGNIVNVSSIVGKIPFAYASAYVASKFALEGFSESVSDEVSEKGIRINIVEPGVVKTRFLENTKTVIDEQSPYFDMVKKWEAMGKKLFDATNNFPEDVAEKILECVRDSKSELRVPVGEDAELFLEMHDQFASEPSRFKKWLDDEMQRMFKLMG